MHVWVVVLSSLVLVMGKCQGLGVTRISQHDVIKLTTDFIQQIKVKHNIAIFTSYKDVDMNTKIIHTIDEDSTGLYTFTLFMLESVNEDMIVNMKKIHMEDNIPYIYIIIKPQDETEQDITQLVKEIKLWDQRAMITVIYKEEVNIKESFSGQQIYDIFILSPVVRMGQIIYRLHEVCMFCDEGNDVMMLSNTWELRRGFKYPVKLLHSFKGNFYGKTVRMGIGGFRFPNIYHKAKGKSGKYTFAGVVYNRYELFAEMLNMTVDYKEASDGFKRGLFSINITKSRYYWVPAGSMLDLLTGTVDVVGGMWAGGRLPYKYSEFSTPEVYIPGNNIISVEPYKGIQWYGYITVFPGHMWLLIILSIPAVGSVLYFLRKYREGGEEGAQLGNAMWDAGQIILWDDIRQPKPSCGMCILLCSYMMVTSLIIGLYMGEYTAVLTTPKYIKPPIESLEQLWGTDMKLLTWGSFYYNYRFLFQNVKGIKHKMEKLKYDHGQNPLLVTLNKLQKHPDKYVIIYRYNAIDSYVNKFSNTRMFYRSKERLSDIYCSLFLPKLSPYAEAFNRKIALFQDMQLIHHMRNYNLPQVLAWDKYQHKSDDIQLITLEHFAAGFLIPAVGYSLALLVYIIEYLWFRFGHRVLYLLHLSIHIPENLQIESQERADIRSDINQGQGLAHINESS